MTLDFDAVAVARGGRTLLSGVTLRCEPGTFVAVLGANGVGKSSLLATAAGLLQPAAGSVRFDATPVEAFTPRTRARTVALVDPSEGALVALTVREAVATARFAHHPWWSWTPLAADVDAIDDALLRTALQPLASRELGTLSSGERQRVWIAVALAQRAPVLLLDEPTSHLDLRHAVATLDLVRSLARDGATVVAALHHLEEAAAFADRVVLLGDGGIVADGSPERALTAGTLQRAYGVDIDVTCDAHGLVFRRRKGIS